MVITSTALTIFQGRCGDRNSRGMAGAIILGRALGQHLRLCPAYVGKPDAPLKAAWSTQLEAARPALRELSERLDEIMSLASRPLTTLGRCATSLATLPVVARRRPDALMVWFDAHADSNTPRASETGYLGGMVLSGASGMWETGFGDDVDLDNVLLVGARDIDPYEQELIDAGRLQLLTPGPDLSARLHEAIKGREVYVHIDCDVLDPGIVPTELVVAGGLSLDDLSQAAATLSRVDIVGLEIAEFEDCWPDGRPGSPTAMLHALEPLLAIFATR